MAKELMCNDCAHEWRTWEITEKCPNCGSCETQNLDNFFEKDEPQPQEQKRRNDV